ncbi:MAG TPA: PEP-CTERM sorting domain-containing protein [Fimbriimonadales bacterium]|nr:PEP-CTERM sorting domain-containing protein [Fimbriimonadales bacterium]
MKTKVARILFVPGLIAAFAPSYALFFEFNVLVTGDLPGGTAPWATLSITDSGVDMVDMTLTHSASSAAPQFVTELLLNIEPFPSDLNLIESSPTIVGWEFDEDDINDAGGMFDMQVDFETSNSGDRLNPGESVTFQVTGTGLDANDFNAFSKGNLNVLGMVHIQGINGEGSGKVAAVPEPASILALIGAFGILAARRRVQ